MHSQEKTGNGGKDEITAENSINVPWLYIICFGFTDFAVSGNIFGDYL